MCVVEGTIINWFTQRTVMGGVVCPLHSKYYDQLNDQALPLYIYSYSIED